MCGIVGIYGAKYTNNSGLQHLKNMMSVLQHRGPDGWGYYISPDILMGQTRLSILDLKSGDQPMVSNNLVIVFNGEIFNYIELKEELISKGVHFNTTCDTEVLLKSYEYWGNDFFQKLNGQFAFLIWDRVKKKLLIARDRYGIRPLYILNHNNVFYFASEMKAFDLIPSFSRSFNTVNLYEHGLLWNTIGNNTIYNNITTLPGGYYAVFENGKISKQLPYYEIGSQYKLNNKSFEEVKSEFNDLLNDAVKLRLRSDVPVGAYLSGGIDSSAITYLVRKYNKKHFKTFSIAFKDPEFDESDYQKEMVQSIKSDNLSILVDYKAINDNILETIYHTERPVFRTAPVPLYLLSKKVQEAGIKVVITGEGADEVLWGYDSFKEVKLLEFWSRFPNSTIRPQLIRKLYPHLNHYSNPRQFGMIKMFYEGFLKESSNNLASLNIRVHNNASLLHFFNSDFRFTYEKEILLDKITPWFPKNYLKFSGLQKNQYLEFKTLLSGYLLSSQGDRMSMAHSVEGRYPFLDHRIVDMLFVINEKYKLNGFSQKYLLKKCFENNLPASILSRAKRPYMSPDLKSFYLNGKLRDVPAYFLNDSLIKEYGIFDSVIVNRFVKKFSNIPENLGYRDNMIISYILSTQMANYWIRNPKKPRISEDKLRIAINDFNQ